MWSRTQPSVETKIKNHEAAIALEIYKRAKLKLKTNSKYTTQQMVTIVNGIIYGEHITSKNIKEAMNLFSQFTMFDTNGRIMKNYKKGVITHWMVDQFYLFDEIITVSRRGAPQT